MRYVVLSLPLFALIAAPVMAAGGMHKHDASIATYNYDVPVTVNTTTLNTGSLRDELDGGKTLAPQTNAMPQTIETLPKPNTPPAIQPVPPAASVSPAVTVPKTNMVVPAVKVPTAPKATDLLPDSLPKAVAPAVPAPAIVPTPAVPAPTTPTTQSQTNGQTNGMMGGARVPLASTVGQ